MKRDVIIRRLDRLGILVTHLKGDKYLLEKDLLRYEVTLNEDVNEDFAVFWALRFNLPENALLED